MSNIEHINEFDTLNAGRNKINKFAIDPANRAELNSIDAKSVANQANQTSQNAEAIAINTDDRLDNIIAGEMQDAEVIDARRPFGGEAYTTLGERLDESDAQLTQIAINPSKFKLDEDVDDTSSFERMFTYLKDNNLTSVKLSSERILKLSKPIITDINNIELDLNDVLIEWDGRDVVNDGSDRNTGIFSFHGSEIESTTTNVLNWEQITKEGSITNEAIGRTVRVSKLTLPSTSDFEKGDYIVFRVGNPQDGSNSDYMNTFIPGLMIMSRIHEIVENDVYIDYHSPYDWSQVSVPDVATITKVNPIENVKVKNANFIDISPYDMGSLETGNNPERRRIVSGIGMKYCVNFNIDNIKGEGMKLPLVIGTYLYKGRITNIENKQPVSQGGGEGYGVHVIFAQKVYVSDVESNGRNSVVDFSGSAFCTGQRIYGSYALGGKIMGTHGMAEHDITYVDSVGQFAFSNGTTSFAGMGMNIKLVRCTGILASGADSFLTIKIIDSDIQIIGQHNRFADIDMRDTKLTLLTGAEMKGHIRGIEYESSFKMSGGELKGMGDGSTVGSIHSFFRDFHNFELKGKVDFNDLKGIARKNLALYNMRNIKIDSNILNTAFSIYYFEQDFNLATINIIGTVSEVTDTDIRETFNFMNVGDIDLIINVNNSTFLLDSNALTYMPIRLVDDLKENANIYLLQNNNTFQKTSETGNYLVYSSDIINEVNNVVIKKSALGNRFINSRLIGEGVAGNETSDSRIGVGGIVDRTTDISGVGVRGYIGYHKEIDRYWLSSETGWKEINFVLHGTTANRPSSPALGITYFDSTLGKPIYYKGSNVWVDATGSTV